MDEILVRFICKHSTRFGAVAIGQIFVDEKLAKDPWWWWLLISKARIRRHKEMRDAEFHRLAHFQKVTATRAECVHGGWSAIWDCYIGVGSCRSVYPKPDDPVRLVIH